MKKPPDTIEGIKRWNLQRLIREKQFTHQELAGKMGVSASYLTNVIKGRVNIGQKMLDRLCAALDAEETEFIAIPNESSYKNKYLNLLERHNNLLEENRLLLNDVKHIEIKAKKFDLITDHLNTGIETLDESYTALNDIIGDQTVDSEKRKLLIESAQMLARLGKKKHETDGEAEGKIKNNG